ncbi:glycosyltransferase [Maribellus comscasis]|uniref:Glycosyltransferase n=1 Tax=Maribellus comscasis TaxID=2681766 RepID=A0A6I6JVH4_9BACT|nr:glycosyltransferase [Maribellus comscasis]QGY46571.1 glycosyltransferase [Maribellus comscasis]
MVYISLLYNPILYRDRYLLLLEEQKKASEKYLIFVGKKIENYNTDSNVAVLDSKSYFSFAFKVAMELKRLRKKSDDFILLNEHLVSLVSMILFFLNFKNIKKVANLYSSEIFFLVKKGWRIDSNSKDFVSYRQAYNIILSRIKPVVYRIITILFSNYFIGNSEQIAYDLPKSKKLSFFVVDTNIDLYPNFKKLVKPAQYLYPINLLYVGKIYPAKGIGTMLAAIGLLKEKFDSHLFIIGKLSRNDKIWYERMIKYYGVEDSITRIDQIKHDGLFPFYKYTDAFIMPSFFEGSPRVLKEAIVSGCPIAASNISGNKILDSNDDSILYFEPGDADDLLSCLVKIINGKNTYVKQSNYVNKFSSKEIALKRLNIYKDIIEK